MTSSHLSNTYRAAVWLDACRYCRRLRSERDLARKAAASGAPAASAEGPTTEEELRVALEKLREAQESYAEAARTNAESARDPALAKRLAELTEHYDSVKRRRGAGTS